MEIPYTVEARPDTGLSNGKFGIWLFLASEVMLFAALFSSYILLRVGSVEWPHGYQELSVPMAFFNTVVLITSSVTMVMAWASLKMNDFGKFRLYLGLTILLSFVFLIVKYFEYSHHLHEGEGPWHNTYYAIYFTITGLHGLHIIGGIVVNAYLWGPGARMWRNEPERFTNRIEVARHGREIAAPYRAGQAVCGAVCGNVAQRTFGERNERLRRLVLRDTGAGEHGRCGIDHGDQVVGRERGGGVVRGHLRAVERQDDAVHRGDQLARGGAADLVALDAEHGALERAHRGLAVGDRGQRMQRADAGDLADHRAERLAGRRCACAVQQDVAPVDEAGAEQHLRDLGDHLIADREDDDLGFQQDVGGCRRECGDAGRGAGRARRRGTPRPQPEHRHAAQAQGAGECGRHGTGADEERGGVASSHGW